MLIFHNMCKSQKVLHNMYCFRHIYRNVSQVPKLNWNILRINDAFNLHKRTYLAVARTFEYEEKYKKKDGILETNYELIYRLPRAKYYILLDTSLNCMHIGLLVAVGFIVAVYYGYIEINSDLAIELISKSAFKMNNLELCSTIIIALIFGTRMTCLIKEIPLRIYYNGSQYIAIYKNPLLPWKIKQYKYNSGKLIVPLIVKKNDSRFILGSNKKARIFVDYFKSPMHLWRMTNLEQAKSEFL